MVGKVEKFSAESLFLSFDKLNNTNKLVTGNRYMVSMTIRADKIRMPCELVKFDSELVYFKPLHTQHEDDEFIL